MSGVCFIQKSVQNEDVQHADQDRNSAIAELIPSNKRPD